MKSTPRSRGLLRGLGIDRGLRAGQFLNLLRLRFAAASPHLCRSSRSAASRAETRAPWANILSNKSSGGGSTADVGAWNLAANGALQTARWINLPAALTPITCCRQSFSCHTSALANLLTRYSDSSTSSWKGSVSMSSAAFPGGVLWFSCRHQHHWPQICRCLSAAAPRPCRRRFASKRRHPKVFASTRITFGAYCDSGCVALRRRCMTFGVVPLPLSCNSQGRRRGRPGSPSRGRGSGRPRPMHQAEAKMSTEVKARSAIRLR
mmetsp:Transcript_18733/g.51464  ORF Transcript_18733/g.51464 Transcript_18733/m.51464 type:complete len:264 (-) Transcript_18733:255-1046(-)